MRGFSAVATAHVACSQRSLPLSACFQRLLPLALGYGTPFIPCARVSVASFWQEHPKVGAMAAQLIDHLQAVGAFLTELQGQAAFPGASAMQRSVFESKLPGCILPLDQAPLVVEAAKRVPFAPADMEAVMRAISGAAVTQGPEAFSRTALQDYTQFVHYGTRAFWEAERSMEAVADLLCSLGLRHPTEPTVQLATAVYLIGAQGAAGALALSSESALYTFRAIKRAIKVRGSKSPCQHVFSLPPSPASLARSHQELYAAVFSSAEPVPCPICPHELQQVAARIPMRMTRKPSMPVLQFESTGVQQMAQFAQGLFQQMESMRAQQDRILHCMGGPASNAAGPFQLQPPALPMLPCSTPPRSPASSARCLLPPPPPLPQPVAAAGSAQLVPSEDSAEEGAEFDECNVLEASEKVAAALAARAAGGARKRPAAAAATLGAEPPLKRPAATGVALASASKSPGKVCKRPAAKVNPVTKVNDKRVAFFDNERSRSQILCRSPSGSFAIKYSDQKEEKRAIEKAKEWVKKAIRLASRS